MLGEDDKVLGKTEELIDISILFETSGNVKTTLPIKQDENGEKYLNINREQFFIESFEELDPAALKILQYFVQNINGDFFARDYTVTLPLSKIGKQISEKVSSGRIEVILMYLFYTSLRIPKNETITLFALFPKYLFIETGKQEWVKATFNEDLAKAILETKGLRETKII